MGSPPRVRSRHDVTRSVGNAFGITSACAEQTMTHGSWVSPAWDHLRVCGADQMLAVGKEINAGSPPRVRSRLGERAARHRQFRITSACAEQTYPVDGSLAGAPDHLRVCGADNIAWDALGKNMGSPPRVRSRRPSCQWITARSGITSACAEQTDIDNRYTQIQRDHLRVCGADPSTLASASMSLGSPPRVRSRLAGYDANGAFSGITSACAEQTAWVRGRPRRTGDHLRVCGADWLPAKPDAVGRGSPPRVRSRLAARNREVRYVRITSACAEQTRNDWIFGSRSGDHLRVCGADTVLPGRW